MLKVDSYAFTKALSSMEPAVLRAWGDTGKYMRRITPKDTGYAKSKTKRAPKRKIVANYGYAGDLDSGTSRQAPDGMTKPASEQFADKFLPNRLRNI